MNSMMRGDKKYTEKVERPSKVLLVCVYDTVVLDITNQIIKAKFEQYGKISKMLIFEKGQVTKMFIQYEHVEHAAKTKSKLDGTKLYDSICKMTIYFSNFTNVEVTNEEAEANYPEECNSYAFGQQMKAEQNFTSVSGKSNQAYSNHHYNIDDEEIMESFNVFGEGLGKRSKTDNPSHLAWQIESLNGNPGSSYGGMGFNANSQCQYQSKFKIPMQKNWSVKKEEEKGLKIKEEAVVRSSIVAFSYTSPIKPKCLYNLFSNFGNISCITIKKQTIYIKFRSKEFAAMSSTYLNNTTLMGNHLALQEIPEESPNWKFAQGEFSQSVYYDFTYDRFTAQRSITINPPSNTVHVSSIKRDFCREKNLREIFCRFGQIEKIQILQNSADKNMALVRFTTLEDSFNAIADLHNENFSGRKMQISFTKSKL